jgi:glycosyltransferase involved in cell wall biosynthesis
MKIAHYLHPSFGEGGITNLATKLMKHQNLLGADGIAFSRPSDCPTDCDFIITHAQKGWLQPKPNRKVKIINMLHGSNLDRIFTMGNYLGVMGWQCFLREWASSIRADGIITDSHSPLLERTLIAKKIKAIVPAGLENPDEVKEPDISFDSNAFMVLFVGRHDDPVKNFSLAQKIINDVKSKIHSKVQFLAIPKDTGFLNEAELKYLYKKANVLLITSFTEGGPLVALEALSEGLPVCSTNVGYVSQVIDDSCGKIFTMPNEAVDFIKSLSESRDLREKMRAASLEKSKHYSWQNYAKNVLDFLRSL